MCNKLHTMNFMSQQSQALHAGHKSQVNDKQGSCSHSTVVAEEMQDRKLTEGNPRHCLVPKLAPMGSPLETDTTHAVPMSRSRQRNKPHYGSAEILSALLALSQRVEMQLNFRRTSTVSQTICQYFATKLAPPRVPTQTYTTHAVRMSRS